MSIRAPIGNDYAASPRSNTRVARDVPPQAYFVGSASSTTSGPSFAVLLFARVDVLGVAWLRIASAAAIFAALAAAVADVLALDRRGRTLIVALGAVFAVMNACFYVSIDRLPLATVAAIEFIGPIVLARVGARTAATSPRSAPPPPASTCSPTCASRASRSVSRSRSRTPRCSPPTSSSRTAWRAARR